MNELKLFVIGESSGDPLKWGQPFLRVLIIANSAEEAQRMTDMPGPAYLVEMGAPAVLIEYEFVSRI